MATTQSKPVLNEIGVFEIRRLTMNPWSKNLKRMVYEYEGSFYIRCSQGSRVLNPVKIGRNLLTPVQKTGSVWFIK